MSDIKVQDDPRLLLQNFQKILHKEPPAENIKTNMYAGNSRYLPISFIEMELDKLFFGMWSTENIQYSTVANEIICTLELHVLHPTTNKWLTRCGMGAAMIQFQSKSNKMDISNKIANTLTKDAPHAKAQAFRNAAQSLGKSFGRDLNREYEGAYVPLIKSKTDIENRLIALIENATTKDQLQKLAGDVQKHEDLIDLYEVKLQSL